MLLAYLKSGRKKERGEAVKQPNARLTLCAVNASRPPAGSGGEGGREGAIECLNCENPSKKEWRNGGRKRAERTCGLIQENDGRVRHQLHPNRDSLAFAAGHTLRGGEGGRKGRMGRGE